MSRGWHFIDVDLGLEDLGNGQSRAHGATWADAIPLFDERTVWDGLLAKHARFADYCDQEGA